MKTFKDFIDTSESTRMDENPRIRTVITNNNEGQEGQQATDASGKKIPKSVYMGNGNIATARGNVIVYEKYSETSLRYETINITKEQIKWLAKL